MFNKLNLNKIMYFKDGSTRIYRDILIELSKALKIEGELNLNTIEQKVSTAIASEANNENDIEARSTIVAFHKWVMSLHNDNLANAPGSDFPNNVVFDLILELRKGDSHAHNVFFRFFMEGLNARKNSEGKTPDVSWIATSLFLQVLQNLKSPTSAARDFLVKYESIAAFVEPQKQFELGITLLKDTPFFAYLINRDNNVLNFTKTANKETGANAYGLATSHKKGVERTESYRMELIAQLKQKMKNEIMTQGNLAPEQIESIISNQESDLQAQAEIILNERIAEMVKAIETLFVKTIPEFEAAKSTAPARLLAMWDLSEWACRAIVALQIAVTFDTKYQAVLDNILAMKFVADIYQRSLTGNYPGKARNDDIERVEIKSLFQQAEIAEEARNTRRIVASV